MARSATLKRILLAAGVLAAHAVVLQWFAAQLQAPSVLRRMAPAMYTRLLQPQAPEPVVVAVAPAPPKPARSRSAIRAIAPKPEPAASAAAAATATPVPAPATAPAPPQASEPTHPPEPQPAPSQAAEPAVAQSPSSTASAPASPGDRWPADTRLSYRLGGKFRSGDLYGDARVQWQREGTRYQVRIDIDVTVWATLVMTSQGEVTPDGLVPRAFEELRPNRRRAATFGETTLSLENGRTVPRPPGVQDTASQFVELSHRFATGKDVLEVGRSVTIWMARPGGLDQWTYDVVAREMLATPQLGTVEAFHLKPRPIPNARGNITAEMWFAPSLQYLPVRIKVLMGNEAHVDLMVDRIEQR